MMMSLKQVRLVYFCLDIPSIKLIPLVMSITADGVHLLQQIPLTHSFDDVTARQCSLDRDSAACIFFSSGSTGVPKPATLTHFAIVNDINQPWGTDCDRFYERVCLPIPIHFIFGYLNATLHIL